MKKGLTLIELLIASVVSIILLTGLMVTFSSSLRLLKIAMANAELSLAARQLRDRVLFCLEPPTNKRIAGLLSGTNELAVVEGNLNVRMLCPRIGPTLATLDSYDTRLIIENQSLVNDYSLNREGSKAWLSPNGFTLGEKTMKGVVTIDVADASEASLLTLDLTLCVTPMGMEVTQAHRIRVPLFGRMQP